jgi:hypothetical protein
MTLQLAPAPQEPGQGSLHFSRMQAKLLGHSELMVHSGRQFGGEPVYVGRQEQEGEPPTSRHCEFAPQGLGTHGFTTTGLGGSTGGAAMIYVMRSSWGFRMELTWNWEASSERITGKSRLTAADGAVIDHLTVGIESASSRARIGAFLIDTSFVLGTFGTDNAFRSTTGRTSSIIRQTRTNGLSVYFAALTVRSAWTRLTRIFGCFVSYS